MNASTKHIFALLALATMLSPAMCLADDAFTKASDQEAQFTSAVSDKELSEERGRFGGSPTFMVSSMSANLDNNTNNNTVSGSNNINTGAFSNVTGFTSVIQNSGNNVIIQSAFQVNVNFQ